MLEYTNKCMPRPEAEVDWAIRRLVSNCCPLPPALRGLAISRHKKLLQAIAAMDEPEAQTPANILKFTFHLQNKGVVDFSPTDIFLGGRYDEFRARALDDLESAGLLEARPSKMDGVETEAYRIPEKHREDISPPDFFSEEFQEYKSIHKSLRSPFKQHDRNVIVEWAKSPENYISINRKRFERALHGDTSQEVSILQEATSLISPEIQDVDLTYRPFAATIDHLVREYKYIHSEEMKEDEPGEYQRSLRMFDQSAAERQFHQSPSKVVGDLALFIGIIGANSIASVNDYWKLWKSAEFGQNILIDFDRQESVMEHKISQCSVGALVYFDREGRDLIGRCLALLESDALPPELIDYQRNQLLLNSQADQSAQIERAMDQLHNDTEKLEGESRKFPRRLMKRLDQATTIESAREEIMEFQENHPELIWLAERAIKYLNN